MADQFDRAQELESLALQSDLAVHAKRAAQAPKLQCLGFCLNPACGLDTLPPQLFCNPDCEREHARRTRK